ncbi:MAG: hypothetical protein KF819_28985 [Labilithrix sp.]|nr:hypothetical protein [Labilithrix sp.]
MEPSKANASTPALPFADPTALGLFGLSIGCASLLPVAFGVTSALTADALRTTAWFCLLFGGGCQFLAGLMSFANKNGLGGTLLTTFSFNWVMNYWALSQMAEGRAPSATVVLAVDLCFGLIFLVMTLAFAYFAKALVLFLVEIDLLYAFRIAAHLLHTKELALPIALTTTALMATALYIAFSLVLANATGRAILPLGGPVFAPKT